ncbi:ABC transporter substrate-binding protein (plasmid) [Rhizobium rosettiformans]|uniref:ABC transporter substrate-binding protein n=1 Tax=Rhizobium rosettiformans TaxID=1368430 RepID=A0ABX7F202_9HYPH|nr:ABC transporter substrate-binding protein [Rhizobium rosettiformans]
MTVSVKRSSNQALSRRSFSAAILALVTIPKYAFADATKPRIAVLDWAWAETLLALGSRPYAIAEAELYRERVVTPEMPSDVIDLGLRSWPNMELLKSLQPDLILTQAGYGVQAASLEPIAPTLALPLFTAERRPLQLAEAGLDAIAAQLQREQQALQYKALFEQTLSEIRTSLHSYDGSPLLIVKFADERILDIYGPGSLFHDVLGKLGLENAWTETGNQWGFSTSGLDTIARNPEARLVIIEPGPPEKLVGSDLWRAIPSVKANRVVTIPPTWVFGALPSAMRFATILGKALQPA